MAARETSPSGFDRQLPFDLEAEQGVLGSILLMPEVIDEVALLLRSDDFFEDANRRLFQQMQEMHDEGSKVDVMLLVDRLKTSGHFEAAGGTIDFILRDWRRRNFGRLDG